MGLCGKGLARMGSSPALSNHGDSTTTWGQTYSLRTLDGFGQGNLQGGEDGRKLLARNERICKADVNMAQK